MVQADDLDPVTSSGGNSCWFESMKGGYFSWSNDDALDLHTGCPGSCRGQIHNFQSNLTSIHRRDYCRTSIIVDSANASRLMLITLNYC